MAAQTPLINGVRYGWSNLRANILGRSMTGITAVSWKTKRAKQNNYGQGSEPDHRVIGKKEYEASVTLSQYEVDAIKATLAAGQDLTDIAPFPITIVYKDDTNAVKTTVLKNCEFLEEAFSTKEGDMKNEYTCPLIIAGISSK